MILRKIAQPIVTALVVGLFTFYIGSNWNSFIDISIVRPEMLLATIPLIIASLYASGAVNELAMEPHGVKTTRKELFGLASLTRFVNQFAPSYVGASVRALYFKKKYDISYAKFSSSFLVTNLLQLVVSGLIALGIYIALSSGSISQEYITPILIISLLLALIIFGPAKPIAAALERLEKRFKGKLFDRLFVASRAFLRIKSKKTIIIRIMIWVLLMILSSSLTIYCIYLSLGVNTGLLPVIFIGSLNGLGLVLSITPAGIGIREGIMVFAAQLVGVSAPITIVMALLLRLIRTVLTFLISIYFAPKLTGLDAFSLFRKGRNKL